ncbi:hypothetical protein RRG08_014303 [Elysia crispata]|uniref:Uncharacterized protein n=1 Tax=Elysia crispata TaxID=231223 RepID=A0AAE0Z3P1_9GAST|nr:hypothetical protein RRG08_014303 [Elysia crispata]
MTDESLDKLDCREQEGGKGADARQRDSPSIRSFNFHSSLPRRRPVELESEHRSINRHYRPCHALSTQSQVLICARPEITVKSVTVDSPSPLSPPPLSVFACSRIINGPAQLNDNDQQRKPQHRHGHPTGREKQLLRFGTGTRQGESRNKMAASGVIE